MEINDISNVFDKIGKEWLIIAAQKDGVANAMTASWGGMGVMWGKNVAFIFIRPQRYTKEFVDAAETLSISVFGEEYRSMYNYMGTKSGRDEDKIAKQNLTMKIVNGAPVFNEAKETLICKKLYKQDLLEECFIDKSCDEKWYKNKDYHCMYVVEILSCE